MRGNNLFVGCYNVCKNYFVPFTKKENITFDKTPFEIREIDKKQI